MGGGGEGGVYLTYTEHVGFQMCRNPILNLIEPRVKK